MIDDTFAPLSDPLDHWIAASATRASPLSSAVEIDEKRSSPSSKIPPTSLGCRYFPPPADDSFRAGHPDQIGRVGRRTARNERSLVESFWPSRAGSLTTISLRLQLIAAGVGNALLLGVPPWQLDASGPALY